MIRKANLEDVKKIKDLINYYANQDEMLPRSISELYENIRDFFVYVEKGRIYGCCALRICWESLAEIKALAVAKSRWGRGIGTKLIEECLREARKLKVEKLFALTYKPDFFKKFGFKRVPKSRLPHKVWSECIKCPKFPNCDEVALVKEL
jgi:amino-acid N-acetyltransferase